MATELVNWTDHGPSLSVDDLTWADDLLSVKGDLIKMDMGGYEPEMEGPWVFKRNGIYYFTMPENCGISLSLLPRLVLVLPNLRFMP